MKRFCLVLALFLALTAGTVSAHEKGDLVLNIEPHTGIAFPDFMLFMIRDWPPGYDFKVQTTADYYLFNSFALTAGLGYALNYHTFLTGGPDIDPQTLMGITVLGLATTVIIPPLGIAILGGVGSMFDDVEKSGEFFASYITIPFGVRFSPRRFSTGAGLAVNIPVHGFGSYPFDVKTQGDAYGYEMTEETIPVTFKLRPYLGWYLDIGFDVPAKKKTQNSFGMLLRLNGAFVNEIADASLPAFNYVKNGNTDADTYRFNFVSASLVFKFGIGLGNFPIGGKKVAQETTPEATQEEAQEVTREATEE
jgi:hypothetical protein